MSEDVQQAVDEAALVADLGDDHPLVKALRAERESVKGLKREKRFLEVSSKFPDLGLTMEDFEGRTPDKFEAFAERMATLVSARAGTQGAGSEAAGSETTSKPETVAQATDHPAAEGLAKMARSDAGSGATQKISFEEAERIPWAERRELIAKGLVEGVSPPSS